MSNLNEPKHEVITTETDASPNVLTITRPSAARQHSSQGVDLLSTIDDIDSAHTLTPTHTQSPINEKLSGEHHLNPFYNAPTPTMQSLEALNTSKNNINVYETDVEACLSQQKTEGGSSARNGLLKNKSRKDIECTVWPGQSQLKKKKKMMRKERGKHNLCGWMAGMSKTKQIWIKALIALLVIGAAIGVGVGVSKAVGGGIWKNSSH